MLQPTIGMKKFDVFDTNLKGLSRWNKVNISCRAQASHQSTLATGILGQKLPLADWPVLCMFSAREQPSKGVLTKKL